MNYLIPIDKIRKDSILDENFSANQIRIAVEFIQDTIINKILGRELFDELIRFVNNCETNVCYETLINDYLYPIFIWGVPAEVSIPTSFKSRNIGTFQIADERIIKSSIDDIKYLNSYYKNKMDFYINRAVEFIRCNKSCFPESICTCCNTGGMVKQFNNPLNLHRC